MCGKHWCLNTLEGGEEVGNDPRQNEAAPQQHEYRGGQHHLPVLADAGMAPPPGLAAQGAVIAAAAVAAAWTALDEGRAVQGGSLNRRVCIYLTGQWGGINGLCFF